MKVKILCLLLLTVATTLCADNGRLSVTFIAKNAVRIRYVANNIKAPSDSLPDWIYPDRPKTGHADISVAINRKKGTVTVKDKGGRVVFRATKHQLRADTVAGRATQEATLTFANQKGEWMYGLGQFQDGQSNVRGLARRLTQVNTQISLPLVISNKGYGVLWNNYGLTEFNPCKTFVKMNKGNEQGAKEVVEVTTTEGGKQEVRQDNIFSAALPITEEGDYTLLLDVGQRMARKHNLMVDGNTVIDQQNLWLPPTVSTIVHLTKGTHQVKALLTQGDNPTLYYNKVGNTTTFSSPVANAVDYTVFVGSPDEIIAAYRQATGPAPRMPRWALGYIHCRERFHSSDEILATARRFKAEHLPVDMFVQDWQYWGRYGWNAMRFDEKYYPDPKALTDSLHAMGYRMMLSVWSKIDRKSEVGRKMQDGNYYIPAQFNSSVFGAWLR